MDILAVIFAFSNRCFDLTLPSDTPVQNGKTRQVDGENATSLHEASRVVSGFLMRLWGVLCFRGRIRRGPGMSVFARWGQREVGGRGWVTKREFR